MLCFISLLPGFALLTWPVLDEVETCLCKYSFFCAFAAILGEKTKKNVILWSQVNTKLCSKLVGEVPCEVEQTERDISELLMIPCQARGEAADTQGFKASKVQVPTCEMQWKPQHRRCFRGAALTSVILTLSQAGRSIFHVLKARVIGIGLLVLSLNSWVRNTDMQMTTRCWFYISQN